MNVDEALQLWPWQQTHLTDWEMQKFQRSVAEFSGRQSVPRVLDHWILAVLLAFGFTKLGQAQTGKGAAEYTIGKGDLLAVSFWQRPELNTEVRVDAAGNIELPLIGPMPAAGSTLNQLRDNILARVTIIDIRITQVSVNIREYASNVVYVTGSILSPGKQVFETIPNLWQIIMEAGGPRPNALLEEVTITRGQGKQAGMTIQVDVQKALTRGDIASLPAVLPGDNVNVPEAPASPADAVRSNALEGGREVVHVFGQVVAPGIFYYKPGMNLFDLIVLAGGPTGAANMKKVQLYYRGRRQAELAVINMERYMQRSTPMPPLLHPGDAIYVPAKKSFSPFLTESLRILVTSTASFVVFRLLQ